MRQLYTRHKLTFIVSVAFVAGVNDDQIPYSIVRPDMENMAIQQLGGTSFERECYTLRNATPGSSNIIIHKNIKDILGFISDFEFKHYQETKSTTSQTEGDSENSISQTEKVNFVRFCSLLIQIAPIAVRFRFREILSEILDETLNKVNANSDVDCSSIDYLGTMFSLLDLRHPVVSPSRINGKDNVDNCSLPIMLLLLKQCQKFRILEELPDPSDTTNDADLTRINYYTTLIGDEKTPRSITTSNFNDIWNIVAEAISRLGDVQMKQQCVCLRKADINEMNTDIMLGLIEVQKGVITLQKYLEKITEKLAEHKCPLQGRKEEVDEWVVEDKMFVETRSSNLLLNRSRDKDIKSITVVGSFGVGKSFTTRHVSLILRHEGYRILPVSTVTEIRELDDENIPTVFIVDDFCGRIGVEQRTRNINKWRRMPEVLLGIKSKIIVCCTSMVYQHRSFQSLSYFCSCVIDIALDRDELRSIAKKHADIDDELVMKYSKEYSFFPFLCKQCPILSRKGENVSQRLCHESIFKNANVVYESELKIFQKDDEAKYTALALLVQLNNYLKEGYFIETSEDYRSVLDKINITLEACKFNQTCALANIEEELKSMIGSYIIVSTDAKNNKVYSAKTPEVYRVLMTHFKMELPEYFSESFPSHTNYLKLNSVPNLRNLFGLLNFFGFNRHR